MNVSDDQKKSYYHQFDKSYYSNDAYDDYLERYKQIAIDDIIPPVLELMHPGKDWSFLDVGCGMGGTILTLRDQGFEAFGTEISPYCLEQSPAKEWMRFGETFHLPFEDKSFDAVLCCGVFEYLRTEDVKRSVQELMRVAKQYVMLWVFLPEAPSWSQETNPDALRRDDTRRVTADDYITLFQEADGTLVENFVYPEETDMPENRLTFSVN